MNEVVKEERPDMIVRSMGYLKMPESFKSKYGIRIDNVPEGFPTPKVLSREAEEKRGEKTVELIYQWTEEELAEFDSQEATI